jgi:hypothetical protein
MDVPLYALALVTFAVLYLGMTVFLAYALMITLIVMFLYLALRYGRMPDDYPHGVRDTMITVTFIGVTWGIFVFLAPKNPIPFIGNGLTYTPASNLPWGAFITIAIVLSLGFLAVWSFVAKDLKEAGGGGDTSGSETKPKQGVGA